MDAKYFWENTKNRIKELNTTQEWVCKQAGIVLGTMRQQITHDRFPPVDEAIGIAEALNTTVEYLSGRDLNNRKDKDDQIFLADFYDIAESERPVIRQLIHDAAERGRKSKLDKANTAG